MPASGIIFSGDNVKTLKSNIDLNGESIIFNGEFAAANDTATQNITGLVISPSTMRSAEVVIGVVVDADSDLYETYKLLIINKAGTSFNMAQSSVGDNSLVSFSITNAGQVQVTTPDYTGFVSCNIKYTVVAVNI